MIPVITIDGVGGAGKGTISKMLADKLGWHLLDSGLFYRGFAQFALQHSIDLADVAAIKNLLVTFRPNYNTLAADPTLRSEECGYAASRLAQCPLLRQALIEPQRAFKQSPGLVADGRDMGAVIFPEANIKFFLAADVTARAQRRYAQLKNAGLAVSYAQILQDLTQRDENDSARTQATLQAMPEAIVVDTTDLDIEQVFMLLYTEAQGVLAR